MGGGKMEEDKGRREGETIGLDSSCELKSYFL